MRSPHLDPRVPRVSTSRWRWVHYPMCRHPIGRRRFLISTQSFRLPNRRKSRSCCHRQFLAYFLLPGDRNLFVSLRGASCLDLHPWAFLDSGRAFSIPERSTLLCA
ncbi:hypothetical protein Pd630_LPD09071 (plasmid) [Rhodococcus opacus PD630]|nr:hypothetical protein Pd630_LPD09071 [Rhodococcus opacus PD630]